MGKLINQNNEHEAYYRMLQIWSEVYNHEHYRLSGEQLRSRIFDCLLAIWSVKEWFKESSIITSRDVEAFVNSKRYLPIAFDLANMIKHRRLNRVSRANTKIEAYLGTISDSQNRIVRNFYYVSNSKGNRYEIFTVLRGAIEEWEEWFNKSFRIPAK